MTTAARANPGHRFVSLQLSTPKLAACYHDVPVPFLSPDHVFAGWPAAASILLARARKK